MPTDTQERVKELLINLAEHGTSLVGEEGKLISEIVKELRQEIAKLGEENTGLKQDIEDLKVKDNNEDGSSDLGGQAASNPNSVDSEELVEKLNEVLKRMNDLEDKVKNIGAVET